MQHTHSGSRGTWDGAIVSIFLFDLSVVRHGQAKLLARLLGLTLW